MRTEIEEWVFSADYAGRTLRDHFQLLSLDGCGLANRPAAVGAAGAILHYLRDTQRAALDHLDRPTFYDRADSMVLDAVTVRNLELLEPIFAADASGPQTQATVLGVLDQTQTGMGGRLLRQRLLRPSMDRAEIEQRLDAVGELLQQTILRAELRKQLAGDSRPGAAAGQGDAGLGRAARSAGAGPVAREDPRAASAASIRSRRRACARIHERLDELPDVANLILEAIADEPPLNLADGGTIRAGYHAELDELRDLSQNGQQYIAQIEARERQRTGIQSLKVRFNNVFGYYIEITRANLHLAPAGLRAQADAGQRRALHHAGAEGVRAQGAGRGREDPHAGKGALRRCAASGRPRRRSAFARRPAAVAELDVTAVAGAGGGREPLPAAGVFRRRARCGSWRAGIR